MSEESKVRALPHLTSVLDALTDMVRVVSLEGRVIYTNKAYDRKLGSFPQETDAQCEALFGPPGTCSDCIAAGQAPGRSGRMRIRELNGRQYSVSVAPISDETGRMLGLLEMLRDVTLDHNIRNNLLQQNSKMQQDLQLASELQRTFAKTVMPVVPGYELAYEFNPCEHVSGDMFDCILEKDRLIMYVADVSGHGVVSSMLAVFFSRAVDTACKLGYTTPSEILDYVQAEFTALDVSSSLYITAFVVVLDPATGEMLYTNAGLSVVPMIAGAGSVRELMMESPPVSGWFPDRKFTEMRTQLMPGERLLLFTDGIRELQEDPEVLANFRDQFARDPFSWSDFFYCVQRDFRTRKQDDLTLLGVNREEAEANV